jgi:small subunit ribosomal protein S6
MRRYETTFILRPNLGEGPITEVIDRAGDIIKNDDGVIIWLEHWGARKLSYEINKESHGYYVFVDYAAPGTTVQEIERIFTIDDRVLRFLTVKVADSIDQDEVKAAAENAAAAAAAKSERGKEEYEGEDDEESDSDDDDSGNDSEEE